MKPSLAQAFDHEMSAARSEWVAGNTDATFSRLERAHILGQRHLLPHLKTHYWMLRVGVRRRDRREVMGQMLRLAATLPGALFGWVPAGNTGGTNVSAFRTMPIPPEFVHYFEGVGGSRTVMRRVALIGLIALIGLLAFAVVVSGGM